MKQYYFYFDEGGMFGFPTICLTSKELTEESEMYDYYFGNLSKESIVKVLEWFVIAYKVKNLVNDEQTEEVITLKEIKQCIACPIG